MRLFRNRIFVVTASVALGLSAVAAACNVPVFRFALERWRADSYRAVVFHQGPLTEAEREMIRPLEEQQDQLLSNLSVRIVDVSALDNSQAEEAAADREFLAHVKNPQFPCLVVQYPAHLKIPKPVWLGGLERDSIARLSDSPVRKELVRRLAEGQTAVWLLLESGDAAKDAEVNALLDGELKALESTLELPELTASPDDALATSLPLEVKFSVLRVPRTDAEQALVAMLVGSEPDLAERSDAMVFPVFGRGRALLPLIGAGITAKNIYDAASFLAGPCSCEVKEQNPGFDLLLNADWDTLLSSNGLAVASATVPAANEPAEAELVPIPKGSSDLLAAAAVADTPVKEVVAPEVAPAEKPTGVKTKASLALILGGVGLAGILAMVSLVAATEKR
jgi:hypothetical protein